MDFLGPLKMLTTVDIKICKMSLYLYLVSTNEPLHYIDYFVYIIHVPVVQSMHFQQKPNTLFSVFVTRVTCTYDYNNN